MSNMNRVVVPLADLQKMLGWAMVSAEAKSRSHVDWMSGVEFRLGGQHAPTWDSKWEQMQINAEHKLSVACTDRYRMSWATSALLEFPVGDPVNFCVDVAELKIIMKSWPKGTKTRPCTDAVRITYVNDLDAVEFALLKDNADDPYQQQSVNAIPNARFPKYHTLVPMPGEEGSNGTFHVSGKFMGEIMKAAHALDEKRSVRVATTGPHRAMAIAPQQDDDAAVRYAALLMPVRANR